MQTLEVILVLLPLIIAISAVTATNSDFAERMKYYVYTRQNPEHAELIEPDVESIVRNIYHPLKPTVIAVHGFGHDKDSPAMAAVVSAKLAQDDCNVLIADYSGAIDNKDYASAVADAPLVGVLIADFITLLHKYFDVSYEQFHLVGYSLGAHIAGYAGQRVHNTTSEHVQRITGLDPAGPLFNATAASAHLSPNDAHFVDVIHTNAGGWGYELPCGHADYYPNGGRTQPNCASDDHDCSHRRAYELLREMWSTDNDFVATKCTSTHIMSLDACEWVDVQMGVNTHRSGVYYLQTNAAYPYARGNFVHTFF